MTLEDVIARGNRGHHHPGFDGNILRCADGFAVSVIAGGGTYCTPRPSYCLCAFVGVLSEPLPRLDYEVAHDYPGPYTHVEVGMPNQRPEPWTWWGGFAEEPDHPTSTVYSRVPVDLVRQLIADHGGEVTE